MPLNDEDAHTLANYLFTHKWLAVGYSKMMEDLLVGEMMEAINGTKPNDQENDES